MLPNVISLFACLTATVPPTSSPQHSRHPAQDEAPHTAVNRSQVNRHKSRNVLRKRSVRRMASCACRATVSASPGGAVSCFKSASPRSTPQWPSAPIALTTMFVGKDQSRGGHCFMRLPRPTFALQAANPFVLSLKPSSGRRYACITLAGITRDGCLSCNTGASPRYDLHNPLPGRIFFTSFHFE